MRLALVFVVATACVSCVPRAHVLLPADAPIAAAKDAPPLVIGEQEPTDAENPFRSDAVIPCRDEEDRAGAREALAVLTAEIDALDASSSAATRRRLEGRLAAILDTPCFELAKADLRDEPPLVFDSALALRTWWFEDGGESSLMRRVAKEEDDTTVDLPGQPRPSLVLAGHEDHPLAPLLCDASERPDCERETAGWIRRAEAPLKLESRPDEPNDCEKTSLESEPEDRWSALVDCNLRRALRETVLPLGSFRAMKEGYFVVTPPPYDNCGSVDVFDLASGAVIKSTTCGRAQTTVGRVPLATLREAAWMMALSTYAKDDIRTPIAFSIPDGVVPGRTRESLEREHIGLGRIFSRGRQGAWTWYRPKHGKLVAQVTGLTFGGPSYAASRYAYELLRLTQGSFVPGCAPAFSSASLASIPWEQTGPMAAANMTMSFDFQSPALGAARAAVSKVKTPAKCAAPM